MRMRSTRHWTLPTPLPIPSPYTKIKSGLTFHTNLHTAELDRALKIATIIGSYEYYNLLLNSFLGNSYNTAKNGPKDIACYSYGKISVKRH